ncbi:MAG TPA: protocatechuate 3,4-dioxygenase subunit alpha [Candidatus Binataceae bacterium]|nr:protocatechuate 3,4-dioxygenase subunit alpha [Candidatus Binataceae bacterium]
MKLGQTPSQTVGPFFKPALHSDALCELASEQTRGERIVISGRVLDGDQAPVPDAMVEIWQANAEGRYRHPEDTQEKLLDPHFVGFGRAATDREGRFRFSTIKPGSVPGRNSEWQAPHLNLSVFARGLLKRLATRVYFEGERLNDQDAVLRSTPAARRRTLLARRASSGEYIFDIVLQGAGETVFFDI